MKSSEKEIDRKTLDAYMTLRKSSKDTLIKLEKALQPNYIPPELLYRKREIEETLEITNNFLDNEPAHENLLYKGPPGTGKTAVAKHIIDVYHALCTTENIPPPHIAYVDCCGSTNGDIAKEICEQTLGHIVKTPNNAVKPIYKAIDKWTHRKKQNALVILDELDKTNANAKVLSQVSRMDYLSYILIVNDVTFLSNLKSPTRSPLSYKPIEFNLYSKNQLRDILLQRIDIALKENPFSSGGIDLICSMVKIDGGDAREIIAMLRACVSKKRGGEKVSLDDVNRARKQIIGSKTEESIQQLSAAHAFTLIVYVNNGGLERTEGYRIYRGISDKHGVYPREEVQYWRYLQELRSVGLLIESRGKRRASIWAIPSHLSKKNIMKGCKRKIQQEVGNIFLDTERA